MARLAAVSELAGAGLYQFLRVQAEYRVAADGSVNVAAWELPSWARQGVEVRWWTRAVVGPDDSVTFVDDDGRRWLEENGL